MRWKQLHRSWQSCSSNFHQFELSANYLYLSDHVTGVTIKCHVLASCGRATVSPAGFKLNQTIWIPCQLKSHKFFCQTQINGPAVNRGKFFRRKATRTVVNLLWIKRNFLSSQKSQGLSRSYNIDVHGFQDELVGGKTTREMTQNFLCLFTEKNDSAFQ